MADAREIDVWDRYAQQCKEQKKKPINITEDCWFKQRLDELKVYTVLEIGCGPGNWQNLFKDKFYIGLDQSQKMLDYSKLHNPNLSLKLGNATNLPFLNEEFDMVFTSAVLQHNLNSPDKQIAVKEIYRVLKPNSYYMCAENTFYDTVDSHTDGYSFTANGWKNFFKENGFRLITSLEKSLILYQDVPDTFYLFQKE